MAETILQAVADITGFTDAELATLIGRSRATAQGYRTGALPEYLDGRQSLSLRRAVHLHRDRMLQAIDELEVLL